MQAPLSHERQMKSWFPFSDYDFYAYLTSGMLLIAVIDYTFGGGVLIARTEWTVVQVAFWTAVAYLAGQLVAGPSSALLEHLVASKLLHPPIAISLGMQQPRRREYIVRVLFAAREYGPLPQHNNRRLIEAAASSLGVPADEIHDPEAVFGVAFSVARGSADAVVRMDQFRNLYGFSRNISFVGLFASCLLSMKLFSAPHDAHLWWTLAGALILAVGMFGRFFKFYAAYSREVFSAFNAKAAANSVASGNP
jgi:hypothetical protein